MVHKRNIFFLFLLPAVLSTLAQEKQMTLEDAVLGHNSYLQPETLEGLTWKNDRVFTFFDNDTLWAEDAKNGNKSAVIGLVFSHIRHIRIMYEGEIVYILWEK